MTGGGWRRVLAALAVAAAALVPVLAVQGSTVAVTAGMLNHNQVLL